MKFKLVWSPTSEVIGYVEAHTRRAAIRKAPMPYRKALGEIYANDSLDEFKEVVHKAVNDFHDLGYKSFQEAQDNTDANHWLEPLVEFTNSTEAMCTLCNLAIKMIDLKLQEISK